MRRLVRFLRALPLILISPFLMVAAASHSGDSRPRLAAPPRAAAPPGEQALDARGLAS